MSLYAVLSSSLQYERRSPRLWSLVRQKKHLLTYFEVGFLSADKNIALLNEKIILS